jgi:hypothetical protein
MKNHLSNEDLVSRYLDNEMSDVEKLEFENRLASDPGLKEEYAFQKDVIQAVKESRRMELKSRLSNIQPPSTPIYQTLGVKIAAVASITAIVGVGTYYMLNNKEELGLTDVDITKSKSIEYTPKKEMPSIPEVHVPPPEDVQIDEGAVEETPAPARDEDASKVTASKKSTPKPSKPQVVRPEIAEEPAEDDLITENIAEESNYNTIEEIKENIESTVEIETEKSRRYSNHYKFYNNKLYLLGDFKNSPYEIIELNSSKGKDYFLYYEDNFYRLYKDVVKPAPLEKVEDEAILDELKIILNSN